MALTTRLTVIVHDSQREMDSRKNARESINTASAPESDAKYEIIAPVQGP